MITTNFTAAKFTTGILQQGTGIIVICS